MIDLKDVSKKIKKNLIIKGINLKLPSKGIVAIKGENGSGKTTLLNILSLLDSKYDGDIFFNGKSYKGLNDFQKSKYREKYISYCFQKNNLISFLNEGENRRLDSYLKKQKFYDFKKNKIETLSQGQRQLLALNYLLKPGKKVYILDEVTASLDNKNTEDFINKIKELAKIALVIIVSHDLKINDICNQIITLEKGEIKSNIIIDSLDNAEIKDEQNEKSETKLTFRLLFKFINNIKYISLFSLFINTLLISLIYTGIIGLTTQPKYALDVVINDFNYLATSVRGGINDDNLLFQFPNETKKYISATLKNDDDSFKNIELIFDDTLEGDYVFLNQEYHDRLIKEERKYNLKTNFISFAYKYYRYNLQLKIDDKIQAEGFFININKLSNSTDYIPNVHIENGYWDTEEFYSSYYNRYTDYQSPLKEKYGIPIYVSNLYAEEFFKIQLNEQIKDDTLYIFDERLYTDKITYFEKQPVRTADMNYEYNLFSKFPNGVKIVLLDNDFTPPYNDNYNYVIVSDNTFQKIVSDRPVYEGIYIYFENNRHELIDFLSRNSIKLKIPNNVYYDEYEKKIEVNNQLKIYNHIIVYNCNFASSFWCRIILLGIPFVFIIFQIVLSYFINLLNKQNNRILKKCGLNLIRRFLLFNSIMFLNVIFASIIGFHIGTVAIVPLDTFGFVPGFTFIEFLSVLVLIFSTVIISYICFKRSEKYD